ncbi:hypothetical protein E2C01_001936 [Portunus trituberculatus]|uniref:Uncharacterized protein n=1 Tax=Portunus trituberculatus TaxID=210409 RepID=A0A5B7CIJ3_PORTR|nr:hypothetical protein [Portunus trituberculatus]
MSENTVPFVPGLGESWQVGLVWVGLDVPPTSVLRAAGRDGVDLCCSTTGVSEGTGKAGMCVIFHGLVSTDSKHFRILLVTLLLLVDNDMPHRAKPPALLRDLLLQQLIYLLCPHHVAQDHHIGLRGDKCAW